MRAAWTTTCRPVPRAPRLRAGSGSMTSPLELLALARADRAERVLRGGRVRPRHLAAHADPRARPTRGTGARAAVLRITADPPNFIAAMQLGVTLDLARASVRSASRCSRSCSTRRSRPCLAVILALLIITYLHVVLGELVPKGIALSHPERIALAVSTPVRGFFIRLQAVRLAAQALDRARAATRSARTRPAPSSAAHSEVELRMLLSSSAEQGEIERGRAGDGRQGLRLRRQGRRRRDGPAPGRGRALDRPAGRGGAAGGARVALHALPRLPRHARRDRRHPPRPRPDRGDARARDRRRRHRGAAAAGDDGARDEGPRRAARPSSSARSSTWRS